MKRIVSGFGKLNMRNRTYAILALCAVTVITLPAQSFMSLASFNGTNGSGPYWGYLIQGVDGNVYGTTSGGGASGWGTVFEITATGTLTTLYSFNFAEGANPYAGLTQDTNGCFYGTTQGGGSQGDGTIFEITPGGVQTTLFSFCATGGYPASCVDGDNPKAGLIQARNGRFYGTTNNGGPNHGGSGTACEYGCGTIFSVTPAGTETKLYDFCNLEDCADGAAPYAGLIQATNGDLYGTTSEGGANSGGTVFQITPSGTLTTLYNFCSQSGCTDGAGPHAGLIQATNGDFYGTTYEGGANGYGAIFKITPSGTLTTLYSFCAQSVCTDGQNPYAGLVQATNGDFYGTTAGGGANGYGTIFKITPSGTLTTLYAFCSQSGCTDGAYPYAGLSQATNGNLYGTTYAGGSANDGTVFSLSVGLGPFVETRPNSGELGASVEILGSDLTGATSVSFNGTSQPTFTAVSRYLITTTVPAGATTGTVQVVTPGRTLSSNVPFRVP
jgi:uncharacterized repeat protein (TIGR03803 family)